MTSRPRPPARRLAIAALCSVMAGCISVLPKEKPVQLYRFGEARVAPAAHPATATAVAAFTVRLTPSSFDAAAAGDRILSVTGGEAAYLKGARWLSPAEEMFDAAVVRTFAADGGAARLVAPGEPARIDEILKLDVRTFEARYSEPNAPPTVVVEVYASVIRLKDRAALGNQTFRAEVPAGEDRIGAITAAFDQAVGKTLAELVAWVDARGG